MQNISNIIKTISVQGMFNGVENNAQRHDESTEAIECRRNQEQEMGTQ